MHRGDFLAGWRFHVDVQRLALTDVGASADCQVEEFFLRDFPDGLVEQFEVVRDGFDVLDGASVSFELVDDLWSPQVQFDEVSDEVRVDADEFSGEDSSSENIGVVRLETFVIA